MVGSYKEFKSESCLSKMFVAGWITNKNPRQSLEEARMSLRSFAALVTNELKSRGALHFHSSIVGSVASWRLPSEQRSAEIGLGTDHLGQIILILKTGGNLAESTSEIFRETPNDIDPVVIAIMRHLKL